MSGAVRCHYRRTKTEACPSSPQAVLVSGPRGVENPASDACRTQLILTGAAASGAPSLTGLQSQTRPIPALNATAPDRTPLRPLPGIPSSRLDDAWPRRTLRRSEVRRAGLLPPRIGARVNALDTDGSLAPSSDRFGCVPRFDDMGGHEGAASSARESTTMSAHSAVDLPIEIGYP